MTFAWLPPELTAAVLTLLPVDELGRMNRVARIFSSNPSPVEQALRLRAPADVSPPPAGIPEVEWLFWLERRPLLAKRLKGRCSAGLSHFAVAKADGSLLTWGDGYEDEPNDRFGDAVGLLGHGPSVLDVEVPTRCLLLGLEPQLRVCSLSCGPEHTLALCEGGEMMSWGCGDDGRLGHGNEQRQCFPRRIDHTRGTTTLGVIASDVTMVRMRAIAAGSSHSLAISEGGRLYAWGVHSASGQPNPPNVPNLLGQDEPLWLLPAAVPSPALVGVRLSAVAAGGSHSLLLASDGRVFSFGAYGDGGRLGHGDQDPQRTPRLVSALKEVRVVQIAAGDATSLALDADGIVYQWGWLDKCDASAEATTLGELSSALVLPQRVELNGARICAISLGEGCPLVAVSEAGQCLWWDSDAPHDETHVVEVAERIVTAVVDSQGGRILAIDAVGRVHFVDCAGEGVGDDESTSIETIGELNLLK